MSTAITPETTIGVLLEAYPELEDVLIGLAPAFAKLRNPVIRKTVAKVATLEQAARIGGVSLQTLIRKLREVTGQSGPAPIFDSSPAADDAAWPKDGRVVEEIDADAMLEHGIHPIGKVRQSVAALGPGEVVVLRSSFRPEPLIETMRRAGATIHSSAQGSVHITVFGKRIE